MSRKFRSSNSKSKLQQNGILLLESLIAIVLISVGMLALIGLMARTTANIGSVGYRDQASMLAVSMIDQLRERRSLAVAGDASVVSATISAETCAGRSAATVVGIWRTQVACALPSGAGAVNVDATSLRATVTVRWDDSRVVGGGATQTLTMESRL